MSEYGDVKPVTAREAGRLVPVVHAVEEIVHRLPEQDRLNVLLTLVTRESRRR